MEIYFYKNTVHVVSDTGKVLSTSFYINQFHILFKNLENTVKHLKYQEKYDVVEYYLVSSGGLSNYSHHQDHQSCNSYHQLSIQYHLLLFVLNNMYSLYIFEKKIAN